MANVTEIAPDIYRISVYNDNGLFGPILVPRGEKPCSRPVMSARV